MKQDALREAKRKIATQYQQLRTGIATAPVVHTDDTGWRVSEPKLTHRLRKRILRDGDRLWA